MEIREIITGTSLLHWVLLVLFLLAFLLQMRIYLGVFLQFLRYKAKKKSAFSGGISVIICAKNEEKNLKTFLPHILQQDYPEFEVVVVNDSSTDDSELVLMELAAKDKRLRYTSIPENEKFLHGKKLALTIGLKAAKHDHVVLTDADCYPVSDHWLKRMASGFGGDKKIVLGYGGYVQRQGLLNKLIRYETLFTAIQYFSYAIKGKPYMGIGRNLAYEKALFFENKGFASHYHLQSGDDDLFINENATRENCTVEFSPESQTRSMPETTVRGWIKQKKRHLAAGNYYSTGSRIRLANEWISRIVLYTTLIWTCISSPWAWVVLAFFGIALVTRLVVFKLGMRRLEEKHLLLPSLLFDPFLPIILGILWIGSRFEKKYQPWR